MSCDRHAAKTSDAKAAPSCLWGVWPVQSAVIKQGTHTQQAKLPLVGRVLNMKAEKLRLPQVTESLHHLVEEAFIEDFLLREGERESSECVANLSVTKQHQRSATALTPKLLNIFSLSAITSHFFPPAS